MKSPVASTPDHPLRSASDKRAGYRPDIDGLRAIAIALVVLSHMGLKAFIGGFVGVDIFFVISGYLLTTNIADRINSQTFSVAGFYERRIRRILPALIAMLAGTSVLAYFVFPSKALVFFARSLLAATFSYSNFYFWTQPDGYFSLTFTRLLLHTWSLGVEEQFYLVLPFCMLWAARQFPQATRRFISIVGSISFAYAAYLTYCDRALAFYMPYARAWEFLIGSALALQMIPSLKSRLLRESMAALSLAAIFSCLLMYTPSTPFPGLGALPPCLATATLLLIGEQGRTTVTAFLLWPPVVFVGSISYSLYLWHWPVILFFRLGIMPKLDFGAFHMLPILSIFLSVVLGAVSWRFIEQPFRTGLWKSMPRASVFRYALVSAAAVSFIAASFIAGKGLPNRFPGVGDVVGNYLFGDSTQRQSCFVETTFTRFDQSVCLERASGKMSYLLFGDSHADALWFGLSQSLPRASVLQATGSSCAPIRGNYDRSACGSLRHFIYDEYLPRHRVDAVILSEAWKSPADLEALEPALTWLRKRHIAAIIIGPVPEYSAPLPLLLAIGEKWHLPNIAEHRLLNNIGGLDRELSSRLEGRRGVTYASVWRTICTANRCQPYVNRKRGIPMLFDTNHLTAEASTLVVERMQAGGELPH